LCPGMQSHMARRQRASRGKGRDLWLDRLAAALLLLPPPPAPPPGGLSTCNTVKPSDMLSLSAEMLKHFFIWKVLPGNCRQPFTGC
jgi:hypothetical protein